MRSSDTDECRLFHISIRSRNYNFDQNFYTKELQVFISEIGKKIEWYFYHAFCRKRIVSSFCRTKYILVPSVRKIFRFQETLTHKLPFFKTQIDIKTEWWFLDEIFSVQLRENKMVYFSAPMNIEYSNSSQKHFNFNKNLDTKLSNFSTFESTKELNDNSQIEFLSCILQKKNCAISLRQ